MRTQWTAKGNRDAGSSCSTDIFGISGGGGFEHPKPPSVRHWSATTIHHPNLGQPTKFVFITDINSRLFSWQWQCVHSAWQFVTAELLQSLYRGMEGPVFSSRRWIKPFFSTKRPNRFCSPTNRTSNGRREMSPQGNLMWFWPCIVVNMWK